MLRLQDFIALDHQDRSCRTDGWSKEYSHDVSTHSKRANDSLENSSERDRINNPVNPSNPVSKTNSGDFGQD